MKALEVKEKIIERNLKIFESSLIEINQLFEDFQEFFTWKAPIACSVGFAQLKWQNFPKRLKD